MLFLFLYPTPMVNGLHLSLCNERQEKFKRVRSSRQSASGNPVFVIISRSWHLKWRRRRRHHRLRQRQMQCLRHLERHLCRNDLNDKIKCECNAKRRGGGSGDGGGCNGRWEQKKYSASSMSPEGETLAENGGEMLIERKSAFRSLPSIEKCCHVQHTYLRQFIFQTTWTKHLLLSHNFALWPWRLMPSSMGPIARSYPLYIAGDNFPGDREIDGETVLVHWSLSPKWQS